MFQYINSLINTIGNNVENYRGRGVPSGPVLPKNAGPCETKTYDLRKKNIALQKEMIDLNRKGASLGSQKSFRSVEYPPIMPRRIKENAQLFEGSIKGKQYGNGIYKVEFFKDGKPFRGVRRTSNILDKAVGVKDPRRSLFRTKYMTILFTFPEKINILSIKTHNNHSCSDWDVYVSNDKRNWSKIYGGPIARSSSYSTITIKNNNSYAKYARIDMKNGNKVFIQNSEITFFVNIGNNMKQEIDKKKSEIDKINKQINGELMYNLKEKNGKITNVNLKECSKKEQSERLEKERQQRELDNHNKTLNNLLRSQRASIRKYTLQANAYYQSERNIQNSSLDEKIIFYTQNQPTFSVLKNELLLMETSIKQKHSGNDKYSQLKREALLNNMQNEKTQITNIHISINNKLKPLLEEKKKREEEEERRKICENINNNINTIENLLAKSKIKLKDLKNEFEECQFQFIDNDCQSVKLFIGDKYKFTRDRKNVEQYFITNKDKIENCEKHHCVDNYQDIVKEYNVYRDEYTYLDNLYNDCTNQFKNKCANTLYSLNIKNAALEKSLESEVKEINEINNEEKNN